MKFHRNAGARVGLVTYDDQVFDASSYPGYFAEFDADLGTTLGAGSDVSDWADQSSNGYDVSQATVSFRPTLNTNDSDFNGHNSVEAVDGDEDMRGAMGTEIDGDDHDLTVYMVLKWTTTSQAFKRAFGFDDDTDFGYWCYGTGFGDRTAVIKEDDVGTTSTWDDSGNLIDTNPHVICWRHEGVRHDLWEDGVLEHTNTSTGGGVTTVNSINMFEVDAGANCFIKFARLLCYSAAHSTADRLAIQSALGTKYGITIT